MTSRNASYKIINQHRAAKHRVRSVIMNTNPAVDPTAPVDGNRAYRRLVTSKQTRKARRRRGEP